MFGLGRNIFVLTIGEEGALLSYIENTKLKKRAFCQSVDSTEITEFNKLIYKYPNIPIYIMLDTIDQNFVNQAIPSVSPLAAGKLIKRRLQRDMASADMKGAISLGKSKNGRKGTNYVLVSVITPEEVNKWVEYVVQKQNPFGGVYLLPLEAEMLIRRLNKFFFKSKPKKQQHSDWQFLVVHNKVSGFRQIITKDDHVIFSRLIRANKETLPDIIAGNIQQEILNTSEYLKRLEYHEKDGMDIIIVVSEDIKESLSKVKINAKNLFILTPYEASQGIGLPLSALKEDKFSDTLLSTSFSDSRHILELYTNETKKLSNISTFIKLFHNAVIALVIAFVIYALYIGYEILNLKDSIAVAENGKIRMENQWRGAKASTEYDIDESAKITEMVGIHKLLTEKSKSPLDIIEQFRTVIESEALVKSLNWNYSYEKPFKVVSARRGRAGVQNIESTVYTLSFYNTGSSLEELFANFDGFTNKIKTSFADYEVTHSKLPERITFDTGGQTLDLQVTISGPKKKKKQRR